MECSLWWWLFDSRDDDLRRWTCLRAWRGVALRKKQRFVKITPRESLELTFVEDDLPLHAAVCCVGVTSVAAQKLRFEWIQRIALGFPLAFESLDRVRRIALHYALQQHWEDRDQLSWLVAESQKMLLHKDAEGLCLMTHAVMNKCPEEILMMMAVEIARTGIQSVESLVEGRHFESARRLCVRMVEQHFAGVPNFPHTFCLGLVRTLDATDLIQGILSVWTEFVEKWGYHGTPIIVNDLSSLRQVPMDSYLQLKIKAKGEPLTYQWFCDGEPIAGALEPSLVVSQCAQPHNEGQFHCEVVSWRGRAVSTLQRIVVVDDKHGPDPSLRYLLSDVDKRSLSEQDTVHHIAASRGGLICLSGCSLLIPPNSFASYDLNGADVSDSVGLEVVLRKSPWSADDVTRHLALSREEAIMSMVVEILPISLPMLAQPAVLSIHHSWCSESDKLYELVLIEESSTDETVLGDPPRRQRQRGFHDVAKPRVLDKCGRGVVSFEISRFGRFSVIARSINGANKENERPLEEVVLCLVHPRAISTALERKGNKEIRCSLWLAFNRPESIGALHEHLIQAHGHHNRRRPENEEWTITSNVVRVRKNQLLHVRIGRSVAISHLLQNSHEVPVALSTSGVVCLQEAISLRASELALDPNGMIDHYDGNIGDIAIFRCVEVTIAVLKPALYQSGKRAISRAGSTRPSLPDGIVLSEMTRRIPIPVLHDSPLQPPQPTLHQRRQNQLALAYVSVLGPPSTVNHPLIPLFDELHEIERDFTPYFYQVEVARFAESFWKRYDQTWWFDKTKSDMLLGMYRVAHAGIEPFAVVASDAFAGVCRVVSCSIDATGRYSEPTLLGPCVKAVEDFESKSPNRDDEEEASVPLGLRRVIALPGALDLSPQAYSSYERIRSLLADVYSNGRFIDLFGIERNVEAIRVFLDRHRDRFRAANREVVLLVLGVDRLSARIHKSILLRSKFYMNILGRVRLLLRLVPEIDCYPLEYASVIRALHSLLRDVFEIVWLRSSSGWLARYYVLRLWDYVTVDNGNDNVLLRLLLNDWGEQELKSLNDCVIRLLKTEARPLQGAGEILEAIESDNCCSVDVDFERQSLQQLREYLLLILGQSSLMIGEGMSKHVASLIRQHVAPSAVEELTEDDWDELVQKELVSKVAADALQTLREDDALANHIRSLSPANQERFTLKLPQSVSVCFGVHILSVDTQRALKITNATLQCVVLGQTVFSRDHKSLVFNPAIPFEKEARYDVKLRAQYVYTALGTGLPESTSIAWEFSTMS